MSQLIVNNNLFSAPVVDILRRVRMVNKSGKLKEIKPGTERTENLVITCPFHAGGHETKAACNVFIGDDSNLPIGYFRCFACNEQGSFEKLLAGCLDCSIENAVKWLLQNFEHKELNGIRLGEPIKLPTAKSKTVKSLSEDVFIGLQDWCPYMAQRKLTRETCKAFNLKYDAKHRQIIFPYYDEKGRLITLLKRAIDNKTFYIEEGIEKPVYGIDKIVKNNIKKCIITEGPFDCLLANQYGFPAVATLGNPADSQIKLISNLGITAAYLMFDNDSKGQIFNKVFHQKLSPRIFITDVKIENPYKDIGDLDYETFWKFVKKAQQI